MDAARRYQTWLEHTAEEPELYQELCKIRGDAAAIEDRFYKELEFGTGGLRGVLGAGTNRLNVYTVRKATQGVGSYLRRRFRNPSVAIGYDSRIHSKLFAQTAAAVFAANDILVYLYPKLMPTPAVSFAVRDLGCSGGVVITASHNPAQYNGYKVYGPDGCQITTEAAAEIQREIGAVDPFRDVKSGTFAEQLRSGQIRYIGEETVERYLRAVSRESVLPAGVPRDLSIVYTPLNGAGISCVPRSLKENGFSNIVIPEEQRQPDGNFPTCPYPNPEIREALEVGLDWARRTGSELLLATDPDCDRCGAAVRTGDAYRLISGNEMGVLLLDFLCRMRQEQGTMPSRPVAVKTIVTTPMAAKVAGHYGVELRDVLTGFKFIGEQIGLLEREGRADRYIFGFEESCGYLSGSFVRDKDAVNASLLICEMAAYYKAQGKTLAERLEELYGAYGFYESRLLSFTFEGSAGFEKMRVLMDGLRKDPPEEIGGFPVERYIDYQRESVGGLPRSNVLRFLLAGSQEITVRPSGTEPKLKVYVTAVGETREDSGKNADILSDHFRRKFGVGAS